MLIYETHATSLDNEAGLASGWFDVDLSPTGERQARDMAKRYADVPLTAVHTSDLIRAAKTAEIAFGSRDVPILIDPRLRECDYGDLTRAATTEVDRVRGERIEIPFANGESYAQVAGRVRRWLEDHDDLLRRGTNVVIGHRATFYALEHLLNGRSLPEIIAAPWQWQPGWRYDLVPG
jgi:probable phosphoglycerate mutase